MISGVKEFVEVTDKGLTIINKGGEKQIIEADNIIPTLPLAPNMGLMDTLKGKVPEVYAIGDCKEPRLITDAIAAGTRTARAI
jgi:pyruvate/2-oxoglutarate dehydrogenase complex dihydrolipoamide dehydrogenase (E3) component